MWVKSSFKDTPSQPPSMRAVALHPSQRADRPADLSGKSLHILLEASPSKLGLFLDSRHVCKGREPSKPPFRPNLSAGRAELIPLF
jgi:hypothetical protein